MKKKNIPGLPTPEAEKAYKEAIKAAENSPTDFMTLGRRMKELEELDKALLAQFMKHAVGIRGHTRKARYLLSIVKAFDGLGVSDDKLRTVGWTKLGILAPYVDRTNVYDLIHKAKDRNVRQLGALLNDKPELTETKGVTLYFDSAQRPQFDKIIEEHGALPQLGGGHTNREAALMKALAKLSSE